MANEISTWSTAAASNTALFPEGMAPSVVNDSARTVQASIRKWYDDAEWINPGLTPTYASTLTFSLAGDKRTQFHVGRRIKALDGSSTLYGTIHSATYTGAASTGIYVTLDSGGFTNSLSSVSVGILSYSNTSVPVIEKTVTYAVTATNAGYATSSGSTNSLSGYSATASAGASQIPVSDASGHIDQKWLPAILWAGIYKGSDTTVAINSGHQVLSLTYSCSATGYYAYNVMVCVETDAPTATQTMAMSRINDVSTTASIVDVSSLTLFPQLSSSNDGTSTAYRLNNIYRMNGYIYLYPNDLLMPYFVGGGVAQNTTFKATSALNTSKMFVEFKGKP